MIFKFKSSEIKMILKCKIEEEKNIKCAAISRFLTINELEDG